MRFKCRTYLHWRYAYFRSELENRNKRRQLRKLSNENKKVIVVFADVIRQSTSNVCFHVFALMCKDLDKY